VTIGNRIRVVILQRVLGLIALLLLCACAGNRALGGDPNIQVLDTAELPVPDRSDLIGQDRPYLIGAFDKLIIDVFGIDELSKKEVQTDASGRISFPLAGVVGAAGKTPAEVETILEDRLRGAYVRDPQVTVNLKETVSQVITVDGEVKEPGLYPVVGRMTLMRAVATAKGVAEFAKLNDVVIFRTVNGQKLAALYDLRAIRRGAYQDPEVFANDVVVVGDSKARRLFKDVLQVIPAVVTPIIVGLR
jgi:polysaccharide biosynthesis/export protein